MSYIAYNPFAQPSATDRQQPMSSQPGPLTYGIELEFIFVYPRSLLMEDNDTPENFLYKQLTGGQIRVPKCLVPGCKKSHVYTLPVFPRARYYEDYSKWRIERDATVRLTPDEARSNTWRTLSEDYNFLGVEIISRVLDSVNGTAHPDGEAEHSDVNLHSSLEIDYVLSRLNALNQTKDFRCFVNYTAGMHVHVGRGAECPPIEIPRGLVSIFTAFEKQIDTVLPTSRIGGYSGDMIIPDVTGSTRPYKYDECTSNKFNRGVAAGFTKPMSSTHLMRLEEILLSIQKAKRRENNRDGRVSIIALGDDSDDSDEEIDPTNVPEPDFDTKRDFLLGLRVGTFPRSIMESEIGDFMKDAVVANHVPGWLYKIASARSLADLRDLWPLFEQGHGSVTNLDNLVRTDSSQKNQTIEIRCYPGSLDSAEIHAWTQVVISMTQFVSTTTQLDLTKLLLKWTTPGFTFADLAHSVGAPRETEDFYRNTFLKHDYADRRRYRLTSAQDISSPLAVLLNRVEYARMRQSEQRAVEERIRHKFESGRYGMQPYTYVAGMIGKQRANAEGRSLVIRKKARKTWDVQALGIAYADDTDAEIAAIGGVDELDSDNEF